MNDAAAETLTLTGFLLARIAEDEAVVSALRDERLYGDTAPIDTGSDPWRSERAFAERFTPARVLAEREAKKAIVDWVIGVKASSGRPPGFDPADAEALTHVLCLLALPYADHEDFREEWRALSEVVHEQRDGVCVGCEEGGAPVEWLLAEARGHSDEREEWRP